MCSHRNLLSAGPLQQMVYHFLEPVDYSHCSVSESVIAECDTNPAVMSVSSLAKLDG